MQNTYTAAVLHWDSLNLSTLKIFEFVGSLLGALFSWYALVHLRCSHKVVTFIGFSMILVYVASIYFLITPYTNIEKLYIPLMCCGFGHLAIFIALTVYIQATAPFKNYFQVLCILGFVRTGIGSPIGDAIYRQGITGLMDKHLSEIGQINIGLLDSLNSLGYIGTEAMVATLRELFGYTFIFGIVVLVLLAASRFKKDVQKPIPKLRYLYSNVIRKGKRGFLRM